ncbi:MAG: DNA repair exonuclease [Nitrososphaerota archaeon]
MTLVAHMADVHLGYRQYGLTEREQDIYESFEETIDKILEEHAKTVVISGDLFHSPRPPIRALYLAKKCFEKLSHHGVKVFCILGDHDIPRRIGEWNPVAFFKDWLLIHLNGQVVELEQGGVKTVLAGLDKPPLVAVERTRQTLEEMSRKAAGLVGRKILITHVPLRGSADDLSVDSLPAGFDYYALGHEHVRKIMRKGGGTAAYPGSVEILSRDEVATWVRDGKGFYLIDLTSTELEPTPINLEHVRPQAIHEIHLSQPITEIVEWVSRQNKKPIVHLNIKDSAVDAKKLREVIDELRSRGCLDVRYRRTVEETVASFEQLLVRGQPVFDIEAVIKQSISEAQLSEQEAELTLILYKIFHNEGEHALREYILKKAGEK